MCNTAGDFCIQIVNSSFLAGADMGDIGLALFCFGVARVLEAGITVWWE